MRYTPVNQFFILFFVPSCIYCFVFLPFAWDSFFALSNISFDSSNKYVAIISYAANADIQHGLFRAYMTIPLGVFFSLIFAVSLFNFNKQKNIQWATELPHYFSKKVMLAAAWGQCILFYNLFYPNQDYGNSNTGGPNLIIVSGSELLVMLTICYWIGYFSVLVLRGEKDVTM